MNPDGVSLTPYREKTTNDIIISQCVSILEEYRDSKSKIAQEIIERLYKIIYQ